MCLRKLKESCIASKNLNVQFITWAGNSYFIIIIAVIILHACCCIIDIDDLQVELLNITQ